jgi:hypothetical protein
MASKRQIEANRRNARSSTGPRSSAGKRSASRNAIRHGLTVRLSGPAFERAVESLARKLAGNTDDALTLEFARTAAEAELELTRVRQTRTALIERAIVFGSLDAPSYFCSGMAEGKWINNMLSRMEGQRRVRPKRPVADDPSSSMPQDDGARTAEAIRRIAPDLLALNRYERAAVVRRDRAVRALTATKRSLAKSR